MILEEPELMLAAQLRQARDASTPDPFCESLTQAKQEAGRAQAEAGKLERRLVDHLLVTAEAQRAGRVSFDGVFMERLWQFTDAVTGTTFTLPLEPLPRAEQITRAREAAGAQFVGGMTGGVR